MLWPSAEAASSSVRLAHSGYALGVYNPIYKVWMKLYDNAGYDWSINHEEPHNTLVSTAMFVGAFLGAFTASIYVSISQWQVKRTGLHGIYIFNLFCAVGSLCTNFVRFPLLYIGRFIHGYGAGCFSYLIPIICTNHLTSSKRDLASSD